MRKMKYYLVAGVMALASMPVLTANAETATYALGDVDMDGVIIGHDTAMVSRYVLDDTYTLTAEQLELADVNADGAVTQEDADMLYNDMQEYFFGDVMMSSYAPGNTVENTDVTEMMEQIDRLTNGMPEEWTQVQYNLSDMNVDGVLNGYDVACAMVGSVAYGSKNYLFSEAGRYYMIHDFKIITDPYYFYQIDSMPSTVVGISESLLDSESYPIQQG